MAAGTPRRWQGEPPRPLPAASDARACPSLAVTVSAALGGCETARPPGTGVGTLESECTHLCACCRLSPPGRSHPSLIVACEDAVSGWALGVGSWARLPALPGEELGQLWPAAPAASQKPRDRRVLGAPVCRVPVTRPSACTRAGTLRAPVHASHSSRVRGRGCGARWRPRRPRAGRRPDSPGAASSSGFCGFVSSSRLRLSRSGTSPDQNAAFLGCGV